MIFLIFFISQPGCTCYIKVQKMEKIKNYQIEPQNRVFVARSSYCAHYFRNCPYFAFRIKLNFLRNFKHDREYLISSIKTKNKILSSIALFSKSAYRYNPPESKKIEFFRKFYSRAKLLTQTRRLSPIWGFYDNNLSLWLDLKLGHFWAEGRGEGPF